MCVLAICMHDWWTCVFTATRSVIVLLNVSFSDCWRRGWEGGPRARRRRALPGELGPRNLYSKQRTPNSLEAFLTTKHFTGLRRYHQKTARTRLRPNSSTHTYTHIDIYIYGYTYMICPLYLHMSNTCVYIQRERDINMYIYIHYKDLYFILYIYIHRVKTLIYSLSPRVHCLLRDCCLRIRYPVQSSPCNGKFFDN